MKINVEKNDDSFVNKRIIFNLSFKQFEGTVSRHAASIPTSD